MKKADLQVYFHDLQKRYDNTAPDPDVQRVDYQVMVHNALTVLERIVDEGLDDDQTRLEAYHSGYDQGRFDEFADRMGKEQAEKVKGELEQQKNCPYCHEKGAARHVKMIQDIPGCTMGLIKRKDGWHLWTSLRLTFIGSLEPIAYCPKCGRPLNEEEE